MEQDLKKRVVSSLEDFIHWLENYGETSFDHQTYFAGPLGGRAKALYYKKPMLGILAVSPMIFSEAFIPSGRRLFWRKQRLPIADAHYAMGFANLYQTSGKEEYYDKAVHFLNVLEQTRCPGYQHFCWGYPFNWETKAGTIPVGTPLITTTPYAYEAFSDVYKIDQNEKWVGVMRSIAEHAMEDIKDFEISSEASMCSYAPNDAGGVINASAYRAFLLTRAAVELSEERYRRVAERNLNFVLENQQLDGSWKYSIDEETSFIDHFHTCFVLKALAKIELLTGNRGCHQAIDRGVKYYLENLFNEKGLPKPFSNAPRLTVYRQELYDYAECINLGVLLSGRFEELDKILTGVIQDLLSHWKKGDGSFRSRRLLIGWDNVPMHRWAQSQLFKSLSFLLSQDKMSA